MSLPQLGEPPRHPPMVHDNIYIIPNPLVLPVQTTAMPQLPAPTAVDANMPRHAVV